MIKIIVNKCNFSRKALTNLFSCVDFEASMYQLEFGNKIYHFDKSLLSRRFATCARTLTQ